MTCWRSREALERGDLPPRSPPAATAHRPGRSGRRGGLRPFIRQRVGCEHRRRPVAGRHRERPDGGRGPPHPPHLVAGSAEHRGLLPRAHRSRLRGAGVGGRIDRGRMARTGGGGPRGTARPLRPLHPDRGVQRHHQSPAVQHRLPGMAHRVPLSRPHLQRPARSRRRRGGGPSSTTPGARQTTTRGHGFPTPGSCVAEICSSGHRPMPATPRRSSATRPSGRTPFAACSPSTTPQAAGPRYSSPGTATPWSAPTGSVRP